MFIHRGGRGGGNGSGSGTLVCSGSDGSRGSGNGSGSGPLSRNGNGNGSRPAKLQKASLKGKQLKRSNIVPVIFLLLTLLLFVLLFASRLLPFASLWDRRAIFEKAD
ncbi:hypothetical protein PoB_007028500 [Plakobranchus ocellatus]|uniref:Uncharacterized protein n=1 Tax=Plakobranchus ocellatus TaxID=259542 RepID=A0AAV4DI19_9GAST|nr:hypothetical protein PoB_007028500 [Plakobranchus ocellatus]